jgi:hypothetical protein
MHIKGLVKAVIFGVGLAVNLPFTCKAILRLENSLRFSVGRGFTT